MQASVRTWMFPTLDLIFQGHHSPQPPLNPSQWSLFPKTIMAWWMFSKPESGNMPTIDLFFQKSPSWVPLGISSAFKSQTLGPYPIFTQAQHTQLTMGHLTRRGNSDCQFSATVPWHSFPNNWHCPSSLPPSIPVKEIYWFVWYNFHIYSWFLNCWHLMSYFSHACEVSYPGFSFYCSQFYTKFRCFNQTYFSSSCWRLKWVP